MSEAPEFPDGPAPSGGPEAPEAAPAGGLRALWEQIGTLVLAVSIALGIRAFVVEPFRIPSESMLPTLLIGDHLFVNKFVYGIKIPFSDLRLPGLREPHRGDVVVFTVARRGPAIYPRDQREDLPTEEFVKRIVGLPGDTVEVREGVVRVNGEPTNLEPLDAIFTDKDGRDLEIQRETFEHGPHRVLDDPLGAGLERAPLTVPPGRYFLLGDNRDHSNDSRGWGTVAKADLRGPAFLLYWSWDFRGSWAALLNPLTWVELLSERTRWERVGSGLE